MGFSWSKEKGREYAILTDEITKAWAGLDTKKYKSENLRKESLRDNMTNIELILNMLAEASTTEIAKDKDVQGFEQNKKAAKAGGNVAKVARKELEDKTGKKLISPDNFGA